MDERTSVIDSIRVLCAVLGRRWSRLGVIFANTSVAIAVVALDIVSAGETIALIEIVGYFLGALLGSAIPAPTIPVLAIKIKAFLVVVAADSVALPKLSRRLHCAVREGTRPCMEFALSAFAIKTVALIVFGAIEVLTSLESAIDVFTARS